MAKRVVIYDTSPVYGGALTSVEALLPGLRARGWSVVVICAREAVANRFARSLRGAAVEVLSLNEPHVDTALSGAAWAQRELGRLSRLCGIPALYKARLFIANNGPQPNAALLLFARLLQRPAFQYLRGPLWPSQLTTWLLKRSVARFSVSPEIVCSDTAWVGEGLASSQLPTPREAGAQGIFWCGADLPWKGLRWFVDALVASPPAIPTYICAIRGDDEPFVSTWPALHVSWDGQEVDSWRKRCSLYVHTSLKPEPFGRALLEARCAGLCPIVPDEGGARRQVTHLESGLIYKARDARAMRACLDWALANPEQRAALGRRARELALQEADPERCFRPLYQALSEL